MILNHAVLVIFATVEQVLFWTAACTCALHSGFLWLPLSWGVSLCASVAWSFAGALAGTLSSECCHLCHALLGVAIQSPCAPKAATLFGGQICHCSFPPLFPPRVSSHQVTCQSASRKTPFAVAAALVCCRRRCA
eukprot:2707873-Amphidinium_carterae.1